MQTVDLILSCSLNLVRLFVNFTGVADTATPHIKIISSSTRTGLFEFTLDCKMFNRNTCEILQQYHTESWTVRAFILLTGIAN